jgi:hypothetical protein
MAFACCAAGVRIVLGSWVLASAWGKKAANDNNKCQQRKALMLAVAVGSGIVDYTDRKSAGKKSWLRKTCTDWKRG